MRYVIAETMERAVGYAAELAHQDIVFLQGHRNRHECWVTATTADRLRGHRWRDGDGLYVAGPITTWPLIDAMQRTGFPIPYLDRARPDQGDMRIAMNEVTRRANSVTLNWNDPRPVRTTTSSVPF